MLLKVKDGYAIVRNPRLLTVTFRRRFPAKDKEIRWGWPNEPPGGGQGEARMTSRGRTGRLAVTLLAFSALFYAAEAAELTVGWAAANDDATAGYDLEVLDQEGTLLFTLNAGEGTRVVVTGLADGVVYTFRVPALRRAGKPGPQTEQCPGHPPPNPGWIP